MRWGCNVNGKERREMGKRDKEVTGEWIRDKG